mgnify:CR=1 FL=1
MGILLAKESSKICIDITIKLSRPVILTDVDATVSSVLEITGDASESLPVCFSGS